MREEPESKEMSMEFQDRRSEEKSNNTRNGDQGTGTDDPNASQMPRKLYQRCSTQQLLKMQEFYGKNTHPDDNERKELGQELGLDPLLVKFWFQNRRSEDKKKDDRTMNKQLWKEYRMLCIDNRVLKRALRFPICKSCCGSSTDMVSATRVELLRTENAFIKEEIQRVTHIIEKYCGPGVQSAGEGSSARASDNEGNASG